MSSPGSANGSSPLSTSDGDTDFDGSTTEFSSLPPSSETSPHRPPAAASRVDTAARDSPPPAAAVAAPPALPESRATSSLDALPVDAFDAVGDFCDTADVPSLALTSRRFARHLGLVAAGGPGTAVGRGYNWARRALRALARLPQHRSLQRSLPPGAADGGLEVPSAMDPRELSTGGGMRAAAEVMHMARYWEVLARARDSFGPPSPVHEPIVPASSNATSASAATGSDASSSTPAPAASNFTTSSDGANRGSDGAAGGEMNVSWVRLNFTLKELDEEAGVYAVLTGPTCDLFRTRFEQQQRAMALAALGFLREARAVGVPDAAPVVGPTTHTWTGAPADDPLGTIYFPVFNVRAQPAAEAEADAEAASVLPGHVVAAADGAATLTRHADPSGDGDDLLGAAEYLAAARRGRGGGGGGAGAGTGGASRGGGLPGVPLYTRGQLAYHAALVATAVNSKVQHFYSRHDWKRAIFTRLTSPTGATVELRGFSTMRLGSFPCFRCQLVWLPSGWRCGDIMDTVFNDNPRGPKELFRCGYGRVEMDIRPTPDVAEFRRMRSALELPEAFPLELLWNVGIAAALGDVLQEHVRFINPQYRTTLRAAFTAAAAAVPTA